MPVTPVNDAYSTASGGVIAGGRVTAIRNPDLAVASWPPDLPCAIPAVDGTNSPIHPSVLDTGGWNGYRYWMGFTPYPSWDDIKENPSVVASNDGNSWFAPATNPIEPAPPGAANGSKYNSDTHMVLKDNVMYLIWRLFDNSASQFIERLYYRSSSDGSTWSSAQLMNLETSGVLASRLLSPSVVFWNGLWYCWTARRDVSPIVVELRTALSISGPWSAPSLCTCGVPDVLREVWHLDVIRIPSGWAMLISDRRRSDQSKGRLWLSYSKNGLVWQTASAPIGTATPNIYRSSFVKAGSGFDCWLTDWDARSIRRIRINDNQV